MTAQMAPFYFPIDLSVPPHPHSHSHPYHPHAQPLYPAPAHIPGSGSPAAQSWGSPCSYTDAASSPSSPASTGFIMASPAMLAADAPWLDPALAAPAAVAAAAAAAAAAAVATPLFDSQYLDALPSMPPAAAADAESVPDVAWDEYLGDFAAPVVDAAPRDLFLVSPAQHEPLAAISPVSCASPPTVSAKAPSVRASSSAHHRSYNGGFCCLAPGCNARMFKRKADLERHYRHVHLPAAQKDAFFCDYPKCGRAKKDAPFHRRDHLRDHYREYHKDEIVKRGCITSATAAATAAAAAAAATTTTARKNKAAMVVMVVAEEGAPETPAKESLEVKLRRDWWRCAKCLRRTSNAQAECHQCKLPRRGSTASRK